MSVAALLVILVVPAGKTEYVKAARQSLDLSMIFRLHKEAWSSPFVAAPAAGWLFYTLTFVALLTVLPGMMPPEDRSFTATALPLASILSSMTLGVLLLQWLSAVAVIQIGLIAGICMAFILAFIPATPWPAVALFAALGTPLLLTLLATGGFKAVIAMVVFCYVAALCSHAVFANKRDFFD